MKSSKSSSMVLAVLLLLPLQNLAQERTYPDAYLPVAGDTLDPLRRDYFKLFPAIEGFQCAAFCVDADSSLRGDVCFLLHNARKRVIVTNVRSMSDMEERVETVYRDMVRSANEQARPRKEQARQTEERIQSSEDEARRTEGQARIREEEGRTENTWNIVMLRRDTLLACTLDSLNDTSLKVHCGGNELLIPVDSISSLFREGTPGFAKGATIGAIVGVIGGTSFGIAEVADRSWLYGDPFGFEAGLRVLIVLGGALGGGLAGFLVGGLIGALSSEPLSYELQKKAINDKILVLHSLAARQRRSIDVGSAP